MQQNFICQAIEKLETPIVLLSLMSFHFHLGGHPKGATCSVAGFFRRRLAEATGKPQLRNAVDALSYSSPVTSVAPLISRQNSFFVAR